MTMEELEHSKEELKNKMINGLLDYVRDGIMPKNEANSFMACYNIFYIAASDNNRCEELVKFHNEVMVQATTECYEKIKNLYGIEFVDNFILYTERLNLMIFNMDKISAYLSSFYLNETEKYEEKTMSEFSMNIYKRYFFDKLQEKLFTTLKKIKKEESFYNLEHKIKTIEKIIGYLDLVKPKIAKSSATSMAWVETSTEQNEKLNKYQNLYNNFKI